jgi:hypothetical protein
MQIFEITHPRKKLSEISAAGTGLGSFASGLASTLGSSGGAAADVAGAIGAAAEPTPGAATSPDVAGAKIGQQMATTLGPQLLKAWNTEVQKWMQTYQVPSVASANTTDQAALKGALKVLIDKTLDLRDYNQLPNILADDPDTQNAAKELVNYITNGIDVIFDITSGVIKGDIKNEFVSLVSKGIGPAIGMKQFNAGAGTGGVGRPAPPRPLSQDAKNLATKGGLDQDGINNMVQIAKADPKRAIAAFKELMGIPPTVS